MYKEKKVINVALADDHVLMRKGVGEIINQFGGFVVMLEASDGNELIDKLNTTNTLPDIIVLDISMPNKNGYETMKEVRKQWPAIKVLVLTMFYNEYAIMGMIKNGANGYILKSTDPKELKLALTHIINTGIYHSELVSNKAYKALSFQDGQVFSKITSKEMQFLSHCCTDMSYKDIADKMGLSQRTIEGYHESLSEKLNIKSRIALAMYSIRTGLIRV